MKKKEFKELLQGIDQAKVIHLKKEFDRLFVINDTSESGKLIKRIMAADTNDMFKWLFSRAYNDGYEAGYDDRDDEDRPSQGS